jgi:hypothetical protein
LHFLLWATDGGSCWFAVTRRPTAEWLAQQIVEAFPWNAAPAYLVGDNDGAYGQALGGGFGRWAYVTDQRHRDRRGRIHMLNA